MLLLHLMFFLCPEKIRAIYVDHQLQSGSAEWGRFVQHECQKLSIPCIVQPVIVAQGNLENQAREARYQAYLKHLQPNEILVLAHHQQDQAETLMLRLLSGAGVDGLSAMKRVDIREDLTIWRPLLDISREQICQWAADLNIQNIEDPSNQNNDYDRAWARQILWPLLSERFPKMQAALARTTDLMQDAQEILQDVLRQDTDVCIQDNILDLSKFSELSLARQRQLLSNWMKGEDSIGLHWIWYSACNVKSFMYVQMPRRLCIGKVFIMCVISSWSISSVKKFIWQVNSHFLANSR